MRGRSTATGKDHIFGYIIKNIPQDKKILDVGFGLGIIGRYLRQYWYWNVDGLDVYRDEMDGLCLENVYRHIYFDDMRNFMNYHNYDCVIYGDSLEHIPLSDAKHLLERVKEEVDCIIVSIPYNAPMPSVSDNPHDAHIQEDVNREYMREHFPYLDLLYEGEMLDYGGTIGVYVYNSDI